LRKWGNSVGVPLRKPMLEQVGVKEGAEVVVSVEGNRLAIAVRHPTLAELLAQCSPENRPATSSWPR
jgi:antitoxin component of MazEF toxin-antitoxin module